MTPARTPGDRARASRNGKALAKSAAPAVVPSDSFTCPHSIDCFVQQAVAGLSIGLILIDTRGKVVWLNRAAEQLLRTSAPECMGQPMEKVLQDPQLTAFWLDAMCREGNCMADVSVRWPQPLELKLNLTDCKDHDGAQIGRALLFCDVTSERKLHIELTNEMAARLLDLTEPEVPRPDALATLTAQELRTLRLLGQGLPNEEIAAEMHVAPSTIRSHLKHLYRKLSLRSRAEAVGFAVRQRIS